MEKEFFTTLEAAEYVGLSRRGLVKHVYETGHLKPDKFGRDLRFSKAMLDEFLAKKESGEIRVGNPHKGKS